MTTLSCLIFCLLLPGTAVQCGGGGSGDPKDDIIIIDKPIDDSGNGGDTTGGSENPPPPLPILTAIAGTYRGDSFSTDSGCEYSVCGSDTSSGYQTLFLDTNRKFLFCESGSSSSSVSIPTGDSVISDYSSSSYSNCIYGTYTASRVAGDDTDRLGLSFEPERVADDSGNPECFESSDEEFGEILSNVRNFALEQEFSLALDQEGHAKELNDLEWVDNVNVTNYLDQYLPMGVDFTDSYSSLTIYKECRTYDEQELAHYSQAIPEESLYVPVGRSGYFGVTVSSLRGQIFYLTLLSTGRKGYIAVSPVNEALDGAIDMACSIPDWMDLDTFTSIYYGDLDGPSPVSLPPLTDGFTEVESDVDDWVLDMTYVVPENGDYEIHYRNCTEIYDSDYSFEGQKENISLTLGVLE